MAVEPAFHTKIKCRIQTNICLPQGGGKRFAPLKICGL
jgi:hypothetical protein